MKEKSLNITYAQLSNKGEREVNEDFADGFIEPDQSCFVLCDGLGGHGQGDIASHFVTDCVLQCIHQGYSMEDSMVCAQNSLLEKQQRENAFNSMKTTLTCLLLDHMKASFGHVGDSRVYLFEKGKYKKRTIDHSVPQMLVERGMIKESEIRKHPDRSRLLRVVGTDWGDSPKYQIVKDIKLTANTSFLLCSDGFWELIEEKDMEKFLKNSATPEEWIKQMEQHVLENGRGTNMDNYTAVGVFVRAAKA